jgi:adenine-specific DNA-methyltransferase
MISPLKYMGSKRSLAPMIADVIAETHEDAIVVDAFAGTCAVGTAVADRHRVYANDVHAFAEVIARTLLVTTTRTPLPSEAWKELRRAFDRNMAALTEAIETRLDAEAKILSRLKRNGGWERLEEFNAVEIEASVPRRLKALGALATYRGDPTTKPYCLFSRYFASTYFSVRQAAEIDSLRCAIDQVSEDRRDIYLFALLHALSFCAATPGHFAQFLVPRDEANTLYIGRIRRRSVVQYFNNALIGFSKPRCLDRHGNRVFRSDATLFLRELAGGRRRSKLVIYADPPYSRAQYSRYYHVLETLVLYDYPAATGKGRYRHDRFETDFSRKARVVDAMKEFVAAAAETHSSLYLSYPKNGLVYQAGGDVLSILKQHYRRARIAASVDLNHSTMGAAPGAAAIQVMEDVYYAEP